MDKPASTAASGRSRRRPSWGLRKRSTAAAVAVVAFALLIGGIIWIALLQSTLTASLDTASLRKAQNVIVELADHEVEDAAEYIRQTGDAGQYVQIIDASGHVAAASDPKAEQVPLTGLRPTPGQTQAQDVSSLPNIGNDDDFHVVAAGVQVGSAPYTVVVASSVQVQSDTVITVAWFLLAATPLLLAIVAVSVWLLVGRSLKQVERIRGQVARINADHLDGRVDVPRTNDELEALALTMNMMLERLQASDREQRRFVSDASHELRSPLATLSAGVEIAAADPSGAMWTQMKDVLAGETDRMRYLVEDLLTLAKANDGGFTIEDAEVDLDDVVDQEIRRLRSASRHQVTAEITPVRIRGDARRIGQVLRNVLDNAERHALSRIRVALRTTDAGAVITVDNDGDPVPEADRARIFERFVRLDESRSREGGGSGLGLAIAAGIMSAHRGTILAAEGPAGECRFEITFPVPDPAAPVKNEGAELAPAQESGRR
ncbi:two-component sensor histidine kinase [Arthrobacter sp. NicSoilB4]|uniref:sensor histidine kinase n=1 Tax=Arthrobacter sp. NicSoilB4 TaxID=2830997 RepID=UPI001CC6F275|nr:HAMP domain-containing sensor histidine kinase [Arthrobacter sp. NicSoilB4]BCW66985.1 two-component sensor histidine kinase [Arthrobacter sp. NicSoilB4]